MWTKLKADQIYDIIDIKRNNANINTSIDSFLAITLQCPAKVSIPSLDLIQSDELEHLMRIYYLKWKRDMYIWLSLFGIFPWYLAKLKGTVHKYPVSPPMLSGEIETRMSKQHRQEFRWLWGADSKPDRNFQFVVKQHVPSIYGDIMTPIVSLISPFNTLKIATESKEIEMYNQSRPQNVIEYRPNIKRYENDTDLAKEISQTTNTFAVPTENSEQNLTESINEIRKVRVKDTQRAVEEAARINSERGVNNDYIYMHSKKTTPKMTSFDGKTIYLPADFTHKLIPSIKVTVNLKEMITNFDDKAALVMDFPVTLLTVSAKTSSQSSNNLRFVNERVKEWINFMKCQTKHALILAYEDIEKELKKDYSSDFSLDEHFQVEMSCTPLGTFDELWQYVETGIMSRNDFGEHAFRLKALPMSQLLKQTKTEEIQSKKAIIAKEQSELIKQKETKLKEKEVKPKEKEAKPKEKKVKPKEKK